MWWSKIALVVGVLALGPVGCGFQPMYARNQANVAGPASTALASIRVAGIEDRNGQVLRNALVSRLSPLGEPGRSRYALQVKLTQNQENLAERSDGKATLGRLQISAAYQLSDSSSERVIFNSISRSVVSYRLLGPTYGSTAVERDAEKRALEDLAEDIRMQLATFFTNDSRQGRPDS